jgi:serine/threonine protein kinase
MPPTQIQAALPASLLPEFPLVEPRTLVSSSQAPTGLLSVDLGWRRPFPIVPDYRIVRAVGRGGMGEVYEAYHLKLEVRCALKVVRADRVSDRFLERFRREARAMTTLDHPNIARIYAYGETEDGPFFTMKYLPDGSLDRLKDRYFQKPLAAVNLMSLIADAVDALHAKGFVHRDLKPQNILFDGDTPFVSDFGLVLENGEEVGDSHLGARPGKIETVPASDETSALSPSNGQAAGLSAQEGIMGTLPYMSPEQLAHPRPAQSAACDIWALGVMLYELVCGERPYCANDPRTLSDLIKTAQKPTPLRVRGCLDERLAAILSRCLAKDPKDRYPTAALLSADLKRWSSPRLTGRWFWPLPAALLALLALPFAMAWVGPVLAPRPDPQRSAPADGNLADGKPIILVGELGWPLVPVNSVVRGREGEAQLDNGVLCVATLARHLMKLSDEPIAKRYVFRAQVRHDPIGDRTKSRVGIFLFHESIETAEGTVQPFVEFSFTEEDANRPRKEGFSELTLSARDVSRDGKTVRYTNSFNMAWRHWFPRAAPDRTDWHDLAVEVRETELRCFFDGKLAFRGPRDYPPGWLKQLNNEINAPGKFKPGQRFQGGLGLIVREGSARFRNVRLETLADD